MLDRRDFDAWWARECARSSVGDPGPSAKHWAEFGFFAAQDQLRHHIRNQQAREALPKPGRVPSLLKGAGHGN